MKVEEDERAKEHDIQCFCRVLFSSNPRLVLVYVETPPIWSTYHATLPLSMLDIWLFIKTMQIISCSWAFFNSPQIELTWIQIIRFVQSDQRRKLKEEQMNDCYAHCVRNVAINNNK